jgi:phospholipase C
MTAGLLVSLNGCGGGGGGMTAVPAGPPTAADKIKHIIVIFQENRTPDNLFHGLPNADIADSGVNSLGETIPLVQIPMVNDYDMRHDHSAFINMYDGGKMDGADKILVTCESGAVGCPPPNPQFAYVNPDDVAPYFAMAEQYVFADRMFQTNQGPSFPAHQYIISGTSAPSADSNLFAAENPHGVQNADGNTGCTAPAAEWVAMIDPTGSEDLTQYPCFEHAVLMDFLDAKGISWRYYTPGSGSIWTGPNAIQHVVSSPEWATNMIFDPTHVLLDVSTGQLPGVSWVIPDGLFSDHAVTTDGSGPDWVASIVNAVGNSSYWSDTAIFITWDDWGGWYDHVAPTIINQYEYGFRVPLIVVSPYAKAGYVSHVTHDFGSILKYTEEVFGLSSLGFADAKADDLQDCFDYSQAPLAFKSIAAKHDAKYFLQQTRKPVDPDDD